jgi:predicted small metal-binding protein
MKKLACREVSGENCDFVAMGETADIVVESLSAHGQEAHPETVQKMSEGMSEDEIRNSMLAKVQDDNTAADDMNTASNMGAETEGESTDGEMPSQGG